MSTLDERLSRFTEEFLTEVSEKVYENEWQNAGGVMPFADAMGVLQNVLGELRSAELDGLCDEMPKALQQVLGSRLDDIYNNANNIRGGNQHVPQFNDEVDRLHMNVWQGGFRYRGSRVVGYEAKYQQISRLAKEAEQVKETRAKADNLLQSLEETRKRSGEILNALSTTQSDAEQQKSEVTAILQNAQQANTEVQSQVESVRKRSSEAVDAATTANAKAESATTHEKRLQQFIERVDENENKLNKTVAEANDTLQKHEAETAAFVNSKETELDEFLARLEEVEHDINEKLSKATGITLFHTFDERQKQIKGHWWLVAAAVILLGTVVATYYLLQGVQSFNVAFITKLGFTLAGAVAVAFSLSQYGKERRLREEYAFKSAISLSLDPYRKLVEEAVAKLDDSHRVIFAEFLVSSIGNVFQSPTERVFGDRKDARPTSGMLDKDALRAVKDLVDIMRGS